VLNNSVARLLDEKNIPVYRTFVGNYMTSIDMLGASITLMKMDSNLKELLDEVSDAPAFKVSGKAEHTPYVDMDIISEEQKDGSMYLTTNPDFARIQNKKLSLNNIIFLIDKMSDCIIRNEVYFCELDSHAGDGDFGMSVAKGFKQLKREWNGILENHASTIGGFLESCSMVIMEYCGGASGPIWGSAFRAAGKSAGEKKELTVEEFANLMQAAVEGIQKTGERSFGRGAVVGDKTLIDALIPSVNEWHEAVQKKETMKRAFENGARAAVLGAEKTKEIVARMGRAGTVGERSLGFPDAGAFALGIIFTEIAESVIEEV
jgi:dihydroxyacetone kinase